MPSNKNLFDDLPDELITPILQRLNNSDLTALWQTDKKFRRLTQDKTLQSRFKYHLSLPDLKMGIIVGMQHYLADYASQKPKFWQREPEALPYAKAVLALTQGLNNTLGILILAKVLFITPGKFNSYLNKLNSKFIYPYLENDRVVNLNLKNSDYQGEWQVYLTRKLLIDLRNITGIYYPTVNEFCADPSIQIAVNNFENVVRVIRIHLKLETHSTYITNRYLQRWSRLVLPILHELTMHGLLQSDVFPVQTSNQLLSAIDYEESQTAS